MRPMWTLDGNVLNERYFFEYILAFVFLMQPSIDNGERQVRTCFKQNHHRHGKKFVDFAGNLGK